MERVGVMAAAAALDVDRKTIGRWKARGAPFDAEGLVDVDELRTWAAAQGLLGRRQEDGRPTDVERLAAGAAPAGGGSAPAADEKEDDDRELSEDDRAAIEALLAGDRERLLELAATGDLDRAKRLAAWGRARAETAAAELRELDVRARRRDLVERAEVLATWRAQVAVVQAGFQSLPGKVATALTNAGQTGDWGVLITTLERELDQLLGRFAATVPGEAPCAS